MGRIFTWDEISNLRVPRTLDFQKVAGLLKEEISREPSIVSAVIFGSVLRGDFNCRSDIDCLVIYDSVREIQAATFLQQLDEKARALNVPINFTPCDHTIATTRFHQLGPLFLKHIYRAVETGGLIKGDFRGRLAASVMPREEIESYVRSKMYTIQEGYAEMRTFGDERLAVFLKKVLEAPMHVALKMLLFIGEVEDDSKKAVAAKYAMIFPEELWDRLFRIIDIDKWYTGEVNRQLDKKDRHTYNLCMREIRLEIPQTLKFLRSNILYLTKSG
ncbi:hypothetical protein A3H65_01155 [Candidatus Giovannonibacteria bacterium RIFCSPLOWO2_02_FULL_45_14]|nr:MAG: hypothetical protein A3E62_00510 [Candidatus Giovannonibacteria bacterium RIFCSPHIGHO2_12_FULL_44_29]OGF90948.1 MAG: hypothetical protein A3H65_01155 [Candidatus Giovannonibacteria bacterium RIFCSPLOWO2_02_FULL_45_14]